jgi:deoxycytidylate deaminase
MATEHIKQAIAVAHSHSGIGMGKFRHGAILVHKGKFLSAGFNQYKTHPTLVSHTEFPYLHAETHSMFRYGMDNIPEGATLYVARVNKQGEVRNSKPCDVCFHFIKESDITLVIYTTHSEISPEKEIVIFTDSIYTGDLNG